MTRQGVHLAPAMHNRLQYCPQLRGQRRARSRRCGSTGAALRQYLISPRLPFVSGISVASAIPDAAPRHPSPSPGETEADLVCRLPRSVKAGHIGLRGCPCMTEELQLQRELRTLLAPFHHRTCLLGRLNSARRSAQAGTGSGRSNRLACRPCGSSSRSASRSRRGSPIGSRRCSPRRRWPPP
jgi:hypothetical protein